MKVRNENAFEGLLSQWSDLETGLGMVLNKPQSVQQFAHRIVQYDRWLQGLMLRDADTGLYLLFQLATNSHQGYSTSHALVCAVLCHLLANQLQLTLKERNSLVHAALTMNVGMTAVQDQLADQENKPSQEQQDAIRLHPVKGTMLLANVGVTDEDWLEIVATHHDDKLFSHTQQGLTSSQRLTVVLNLVDRYAAIISPRRSRAGRSAIESAQSILGMPGTWAQTVAKTLIRTIGLCPPGTYVKLDSDETGIVIKRSLQPNQPLIAILTRPDGTVDTYPRLHNTSEAYPRIRTAVPTSSMRMQFNHFYILQLGAQAL